jgi:succinyl-CoA synthetase alpha subunit
MNKHFD